MTPDEQVRMMQRCREEIMLLRGRISELAPKAEAYDALVRIIALLPQPPQGYAEDLAWVLAKEIDLIERLRKPSPSKEGPVGESHGPCDPGVKEEPL